jgi:hypothetical protein
VGPGGDVRRSVAVEGTKTALNAFGSEPGSTVYDRFSGASSLHREKIHQLPFRACCGLRTPKVCVLP